MSDYPDAPEQPPLAGLAGALLPAPRSVRPAAGWFELAPGTALAVGATLDPPERDAADQLAAVCAAHGAPLGRCTAPPGDRPSIVLRVADPQAPSAPPRPGEPDRAAQGYRLTIAPQRVELVGRSPAGLFYGFQTLLQVAGRFGRRWPAAEIEDEPDYAVRGLSFDVSRGRVPTLETLKALADRLAAFKINHLQLYVEHTFAFSFNPRIGEGCSPLTAAEIRALDAHCARRRIELVPSLASCGHMGFILSLPEYRHLAAVGTEKSWWEMSWRERVRGLTLDVTSPEARALLERMYAEYLPLFSSGLANVCCDETYDLGQGRTQERARAAGADTLYLEHLHFLHALCRRHGKRLMFWSDILRKHPERLPRVPRDAIVLHWSYAADADYEGTALFPRAGLTTFICPGTSAWNRVLSDMDAAELNIRRFAAAGLRLGATGLLNTDWGDEGHVQLPAVTWHALVLGAAAAWNAAAPPADVFDRAFGRLVLGDESGRLVAALRRAAAASAIPRTWPAFCAPLDEVVPEEALPAERLRRWQAHSLEAAELLAGQPARGGPADADVRELALACRMNALVARRLALARRLAASCGRPDAALRAELAQFAEACAQLIPRYEAAWLARHKPSCLREVTAAIRRVAAEARAAAGNRSRP